MVMFDHFFTGLDCGGTSCRIAIAAPGSNQHWLGCAGPANIATIPICQLELEVRSALQQALGAAGISEEQYRRSSAAVYAGCAGWSAAEKRAEFAGVLERITGCKRIQLVPDFELATVAATGGSPGIVLSAGTGCVASALSNDGSIIREDGFGWLLGDAGSAFYIGKKAIHHACIQLQNREYLDALSIDVTNALHADSLTELLSAVYTDLKPSAIAALAKPTAQHAESGVPAAQAIVSDAVRAQFSTIARLNTRVYPGLRVPVWLMGGLMQPGSILHSQLRRMLEEEEYEVREPVGTAVETAAILAKKIGTQQSL